MTSFHSRVSLWMWCVEINIYYCIGYQCDFSSNNTSFMELGVPVFGAYMYYRIVIVCWWNFSLISMNCPYFFWLLLVWCLFWQVCFWVPFVGYHFPSFYHKEISIFDGEVYFFGISKYGSSFLVQSVSLYLFIRELGPLMFS